MGPWCRWAGSPKPGSRAWFLTKLKRFGTVNADYTHAESSEALAAVGCCEIRRRPVGGGWVYPRRAACRDRDHWHPDRVPRARGSDDAGGSAAGEEMGRASCRVRER